MTQHPSPIVTLHGLRQCNHAPGSSDTLREILGLTMPDSPQKFQLLIPCTGLSPGGDDKINVPHSNRTTIPGLVPWPHLSKFTPGGPSRISGSAHGTFVSSLICNGNLDNVVNPVGDRGLQEELGILSCRCPARQSVLCRQIASGANNCRVMAMSGPSFVAFGCLLQPYRSRPLGKKTWQK